MVIATFDEMKLKDIFKQAILELFQEEPELFSSLFVETMEDMGLLKAMEEVDEDDIVSRDEIFEILGQNE